MVDTRLARLTTPARARDGPSQAVSRLRASSVPAEASKRLEWPLGDYASTSPRKRKRTSIHEDSLSKPTLQSQGTRTRTVRTSQREVKRAPSHAAEPRARGMSFADREIIAAGLAVSLRANSRTRSATRSSSVDGRLRRRCASTSRAQSEIPSERPPPRHAASRTRRNDRGSAKSAPRAASTPLAAAAASRRTKASGTSRGRAREKEKTRARSEDHDTPMVIPMNKSWETDESSVSGGRSAKRRRLSPPLSRSLRISRMTLGDEEDSQETAAEEDFEMLDGPQSLPWMPVNPASQHSEYIPPGLNALIDDMKRALVLQISARQKAENMHAEELQRRLDLEQEAARLAAANRALEAECSAWTTRGATASGTRTSEPVLVWSDRPPQLAVNTVQYAATSAAGPELGAPGLAGPSGITADVEMAEATRTVSATRAVGTGAEHGNGSPSEMPVRGTTTTAATAAV